MSKTNKSKTIERKIYFYKIICTVDGEECNISGIFKKYLYLLGDDMTNLEERGLAISYYDKYHFLDLAQDDMDEDVYKGKFYNLRSTDFPYLFNMQNGSKSEIPSKDQDTLMEQTHFICFPKQRLIASEYNYYGARIEHLSDYFVEIFSAKFPSKTIKIKIDPIIIPEYFKQIVDCTSISKVQFKVAHPGLKILTEEKIIGLSDIMNNNVDENSDFCINIEISGAGRGKPVPLKDTKSFLKKIISAVKKSNAFDVTKEDDKDYAFKSARIKAYNPKLSKVVPYDLLDEKLVHTCRVKKISSKSKYVDSKEMFEEIIKAYNAQKDAALKYMERI